MLLRREEPGSRLPVTSDFIQFHPIVLYWSPKRNYVVAVNQSVSLKSRKGLQVPEEDVQLFSHWATDSDSAAPADQTVFSTTDWHLPGCTRLGQEITDLCSHTPTNLSWQNQTPSVFFSPVVHLNSQASSPPTPPPSNTEMGVGLFLLLLKTVINLLVLFTYKVRLLFPHHGPPIQSPVHPTIQLLERWLCRMLVCLIRRENNSTFIFVGCWSNRVVVEDK